MKVHALREVIGQVLLLAGLFDHQYRTLSSRCEMAYSHNGRGTRLLCWAHCSRQRILWQWCLS